MVYDPLASTERTAHRTNEKPLPRPSLSFSFVNCQYLRPSGTFPQDIIAALKITMRLSIPSSIFVFAVICGPVSDAFPASVADNTNSTPAYVNSTSRNPFESPYNTCCYSGGWGWLKSSYKITLVDDISMVCLP